jgi:integrase
MAYIRKLRSGKWQATVRLPSGKKTTRTDPLKRVVVEWGKAEETRIARGEWRDQRSGRVEYEEWRDRWLAARVVEPETARRDKGVLANHLDPQWTGWKVPAITPIEVQGWVRKMQAAGVGAHAIRHAYNLLSTMLRAAKKNGLIDASPCQDIDLPATPEKLPEWFTADQLDAICEQLPVTYVAGSQLMAWCGLRWGEAAGLRVGDINFLRRRLAVIGVMPQLGGVWKEYPKTSKSRREIPVEPEVLELLAPHAAGKARGELLFLTERPYRGQRRPWSGANWRTRWQKAVAEAEDAHPELEIPDYAPHALRHTAASWLVQSGVPLYDVQKLLGHESFQITQRYAHLAPDAHDSVEKAWRRLRQKRQSPEADAGEG